jgi:hypothetical protein
MTSLFKMALESKKFEEQYGWGGASKNIDKSQLDKSKINALKKHSDLLNALDQWALIADRNLIPKLIELGSVVNKLYDFKDDLTLYRGFGVSRFNNFQDTMGLIEERRFINKIKEHRVNDSFRYNSSFKAISFSTDLKIAEAFGSVVVRTMVNPLKDFILILTDELCYIVSEMRNIELETQKEVILLPPFDITFVVVKK